MKLREEAIKELNELLKKELSENKLKFLINFQEEAPETIEVEDILTREVSWNIDSERSDVGTEDIYYIFIIKGIGELKVFQFNLWRESFFGTFTCYYEDEDTLIIDDEVTVDQEKRKIENFINMINLSKSII